MVIGSPIIIGGGGGGAKNILSGTSNPTSADGSDGDIYLQTIERYWMCDTEYYVDSTNQLICSHSADFYKTSNDPAICAHMYDGAYYGPLIVSDVEDGVKYTMNTGSPFTAVIDGKTWYVGTTNYWNTSSDNPSVPTLYNTGLGPLTQSTAQDWVEALFEAANFSNSSTLLVINTYCKVNGVWQNLIGTDINDINTG